MVNIQITQKLRPLKIGYVIRPDDREALEEVIRVNTVLWGSTYNPIIVLYKKTPKIFSSIKGPKAKEIVEGNIRFFEPDILVITKDIKPEELPNQNCEIMHIKEVLENFSKRATPKIGISIFNVANNFYNQELKFKREDNLSLFFPHYKKNSLFLKSIFGDLPDVVKKTLGKNIFSDLKSKSWSVTSSNYMDYHNLATPPNLFKVLGNYKIEIDYAGHVNRNQKIILLLDENSFIDIVDYINLKAAGYYVLPVAISVSKNKDTKKACLNYISQNTGIHTENKSYKYTVTIQKSRSIVEKDWEEFYKFLSPPKFPDGDSKCMMQSWMPPFWSQYHREQGQLGCTSWFVKSNSTEINSEDRRIRIETLPVDFELGEYTGEPKFSNDISSKIYSSDILETEIYPSGSAEVARAADIYGLSNWVIKSNTLTHLCQHDNSSIHWSAAKADEVIIGWLKSKGWDAKISDAGKVAYQILKHLGGVFGIRFIQNENLINFITDKKINNKSFVLDSGTVAAGEFHRVLKKIKKDHLPYWDEENYFQRFFKHKIFQLGAEVQCTVCSRKSWYSISSLEYSLSCPHCLGAFDLPSHDPKKEIQWAYKTIGPFAARGKSAGAFSVLLTQNFFGNDRAFSASTSILSFEMEKESKKIEIDLCLFYRSNAWFDKTTELVFCECKTASEFSKKDIDKMKLIAQEFPNSILVFSTMKSDLGNKEKKLLKPFVVWCNKYSERDRPRNPVMILTGVELFSDTRPPYCWKDKGDKYKEFVDDHHISTLLEICKATQKIYLGIDSWRKQWHEAREKKVEKKKAKKL